MTNTNYLGFFFAVISATLWGISGTVAQFLFEQKGLNPEWLVCIRMMSAGALLLLGMSWNKKSLIWTIWKEKSDRRSLWVFGVLGMLGVQYTYFAAIQHSNAATATVLQYLGPVFIAIYFVVINHKLPSLVEMIAIVLAMIGTYLMVTHGDWQNLSISLEALFWGIMAAVTLAFYTIQPAKLLRKFNSGVVVGWGMFLGGLSFSIIGHPWEVPGSWDSETFLAVAFIIVFGSLIPFFAYLTAVKWIGAQTSSLLACAEPLSAAFFAVLWLQVPFGMMDWVGTCCIILTISILVIVSGKKKENT